eukprot:3411359-Prymnesium_polylepis.1
MGGGHRADGQSQDGGSGRRAQSAESGALRKDGGAGVVCTGDWAHHALSALSALSPLPTTLRVLAPLSAHGDAANARAQRSAALHTRARR